MSDRVIGDFVSNILECGFKGLHKGYRYYVEKGVCYLQKDSEDILDFPCNQVLDDFWLFRPIGPPHRMPRELVLAYHWRCCGDK